jgi:hypothetical protein
MPEMAVQRYTAKGVWFHDLCGRKHTSTNTDS